MEPMMPLTPDPEPVFGLKASDALCADTVSYYAELCYKHGLTEQYDQVLLALQEIKLWQHRYAQKIKMPDHKHVPVTSAHESATVGSYLAAATAAFRDQVSTANTARSSPTPDVPDLRRMGADWLADMLGMEQVPEPREGFSFDLADFVNWVAKAISRLAAIVGTDHAELQRLLRLAGDPVAEKVDRPWCADPDCEHAPDGGNHPVVPSPK